MCEFWEKSFREMKTLWGFEPCDSALVAKDFFLKQNAREILIPGIGYGRNAKIFCDNGFLVSGIEISGSAIEMAKKENGLNLEIFHGSVTAMPFNDKIYDGIFCYALLHLLNARERRCFLEACYRQLKPGGYMIFTVISKKVPMYGQGKRLSKDRYERMQGVSVFFYDFGSVQKEFSRFGLVDFSEIDEPVKHMKDESPMRFIIVKCMKKL